MIKQPIVPTDYRACLSFSDAALAPAPPPPAPGPALPPTPALPRHLHFGGSLSPKHNALGSKPEKNRTFRQQKRYEIMVQLENAAVPEGMAAAMLCISVPRLRTIKKSADYLKCRMRLTYGIVVDHEARLSQIKEQRKEILTELLPDAFQAIANVLKRRPVGIAQEKLQIAVAQDVMDRQGDLAKVSKTEVKAVPNFDWNPLDERNASIFDTIRAAASSRSTAQSVASTIELSRAFSESSTIDVKEQQEALELLEKQALAAFPGTGMVN